jgi:hypothetical protein
MLRGTDRAKLAAAKQAESFARTPAAVTTGQRKAIPSPGSLDFATGDHGKLSAIRIWVLSNTITRFENDAPPGQRCGSYPFAYLADDTGIPYCRILALADLCRTQTDSYWSEKAQVYVVREHGLAAYLVLIETIKEHGRGELTERQKLNALRPGSQTIFAQKGWAMPDNQIYGWFDDPDQASPSYDPPHNAPCLFCAKPISPDDARTHCLMYAGPIYAKRSYFYRTHRTCDDVHGGETAMDSIVLDMISRNRD